MIKKITYVTGNWAKIASARQILEPLGIEVDNIKMDTIEIQADDVEEIELYTTTTDRTLTVGVYPDFKPYAYTSKSGNLVGFAIEFANAVAKSLDANIEFMVYDDTETLSQDSQDDKIMLAIGPFTKSEEVPEDFYFSKAYLDMSQVVIMRDDNVGKIPEN